MTTRYQPLTMETGQQPANPSGTTPLLAAAATAVTGGSNGSGGNGGGSHNFHSGPRSPFYCATVFADCGAAMSRSAARLDPVRQQLVGYVSGALFSIGWWLFIDGIAFNASRADKISVVQIGFEDWIPGIISTLALIIVNLIDRETLSADDFAYSGQNVACKARACAFLGVTMALGALGGALAVLSLKFIIPGVSGDAFYVGQSITLQNFLIFFSSMVLWFGRNHSDEGGIAI
ncbi:hypothetical protein BC831DRAFT_497328 [Entophlyctis helioformis]|nr:hypothetical protein BC831DRAFT_497328 [Entophlyctis helioformis]